MENEPLDSIERQVRSTVETIRVDGSRDRWQSDRIWTSEIKSRLGKLGRDNRFYICASGWTPPHGQGEWLYDMVWLQIQNDRITGVPLALECEWGLDRKSIEDDFCKLVLARADHRVLILQQRTQEDALRVFDDLLHMLPEIPMKHRRHRASPL